MGVPYTFGTATTSIPLSNLDANFNTPVTLGNTTVGLGNTVTTVGNLTLTNATISSGNVTVTSASLSGNLTFTGTGNRITGDFSNATIANRVAFQSSTTNGNTALTVIPNGTAVVSAMRFYNNSDVTNASYLNFGTNASAVFFESNLSGITYLPMTFSTGGSERLRIDTSGNVGIGTSSPSGRLHVAQSGSDINPTLEATTAGYAVNLQLVGNNAAGSRYNNIICKYGSTEQWYIGGNGSDATIAFRTGSASTERMRITSGGDLIVGGTTVFSNARVTFNSTTAANPCLSAFKTVTGDTANPAIVVSKFDNDSTTAQVLMQFLFNNGASGLGQINGNGSGAAAFGTYSDIRLKENITNIDSQLGNICALRPVEFDYKTGGHQIGFIAQEMQEIYPDAVGTSADDMLTITGWSKTEARLVKAIQEQQAMIEELKQEVALLKSK